MVQRFSFIIGVVALCITLCLARDPRAITVRFVNVSSYLKVTPDVKMNEIVAQKLNEMAKIHLQTVTKYTKAFMDFKAAESGNSEDLELKKSIASELLEKVPVDAQNGLVEYVQAFKDFKDAEAGKFPDLEVKRYNAAQKHANLGFIIFVSGPFVNNILFPDILKKLDVLYMLAQYVYAEILEGESPKDIKNAQVKQFTKIEIEETEIAKMDAAKLGENEVRSNYQALEFTGLKSFPDVVLTLGSVHPNEVYLELDKVNAHDIKITTELTKLQNEMSSIQESETYKEIEYDVVMRFQNVQKRAVDLQKQLLKKIPLSDLVRRFLGKLNPIFHEDLKTKNAEWANAIGDTITGVSLKFTMEGTKKDGSKATETDIKSQDDLDNMSETLQQAVENLVKDGKSRYIKVDVKYYFTLTFVWNSYTFSVSE